LVPVDKLGTEWMNWVLVGVIPAFILFMLPFEERYTRSELDRQE
jgi:hypothetical protein